MIIFFESRQLSLKICTNEWGHSIFVRAHHFARKHHRIVVGDRLSVFSALEAYTPIPFRVAWLWASALDVVWCSRTQCRIQRSGSNARRLIGLAGRNVKPRSSSLSLSSSPSSSVSLALALDLFPSRFPLSRSLYCYSPFLFSFAPFLLSSLKLYLYPVAALLSQISLSVTDGVWEREWELYFAGEEQHRGSVKL